MSAHIPAGKKTDNLSAIDKERITVRRIKAEDMQQFRQMPYCLEHDVKHYVPSNGHPFAYIDLDKENIAIAERELAKVYAILTSAPTLTKLIPRGFNIPIKEMVYTPSRMYGYTRLICSPHTYTGRISKYPLSLSFMTDLRRTISETHGRLFYGQNGEIEKAEVFCWRNKKGCFFYLTAINGNLLITKVETADTSGIVKTVYTRNASG